MADLLNVGYAAYVKRRASWILFVNIDGVVLYVRFHLSGINNNPIK